MTSTFDIPYQSSFECKSYDFESLLFAAKFSISKHVENKTNTRTKTVSNFGGILASPSIYGRKS